jgi:hypothetical protein
MRKIREILRLTFECGRSQREIASLLWVSVGSITGYLKRTRAAGLTREIAQTLTDKEVEALAFHYDNPKQTSRRAPIDFAHVHHGLQRSTATLELLWGEYQQVVVAHGEGLRPYAGPIDPERRGRMASSKSDPTKPISSRTKHRSTRHRRSRRSIRPTLGLAILGWGVTRQQYAYSQYQQHTRWRILFETLAGAFLSRVTKAAGPALN